MLHDILLALGGHPGDLIYLKNNTFFLVSQTLPHLQEIECQEIENIVQVGARYLQLKQFIEKLSMNTYASNQIWNSNNVLNQSMNSPSPFPNSNQPSLYRKAIANGIEGISNSYLQHLTKIEQRCLRNPIMSLAYLKSELKDYDLIFQHLLNFCQCIEEKNMRGNELLDELEDRSRTGVNIVKMVFEKLSELCYDVLLSNIMSWMIYGHINTSFDEFFIESDANIFGTIRRVHQKQSLRAWNTQYTVKHEMLPQRISLKMAEKILFIGKAINILQADTSQQPSLGTSFNAESRLKLSDYNVNTPKSIPQKQLYKYSEALKKHQGTGLRNMASFEYTINSIRASVARYLWNLIVVESDFMLHLESLKDYFLLGKGDFYHTFIEEIRGLMFTPPSKNAANDIRLLFHEAQKKTSLEDNPLMQNFEIVFQKPSIFARTARPPTQADSTQSLDIESQESSAKNIFESWITALRVECNVKWPLHLFFHKKILDRYNVLFQFLFTMKRLQQNVQLSWIPLLKRKSITPLQNIQMQFHSLRAKISFIIDNLLYYLQVDVINAHYQQLINTIEKLQDFDSVRKAHNNFLSTISTQCFLNSKEVKESIRKLSAIIVQFCLIVQSDYKEILQFDNIEVKIKDPSLELKAKVARLKVNVEMLTEQWDQQTNALFHILSNVKLTSPYLTQLLLRMDYNRYFSEKNQDKNGQSSQKDEMVDE